MPRSGARRELAQLPAAPRHAVRGDRLPARDVAHRREVVVVDDDRLVAGEHRVGDDRADRHLVHDDVGARPRRVAQQVRARRTTPRIDLGREDLGVWPAARRTSRTARVCAPTAPGSSVGTNWWMITPRPDHRGAPTTGSSASSSLRPRLVDVELAQAHDARLDQLAPERGVGDDPVHRGRRPCTRPWRRGAAPRRRASRGRRPRRTRRSGRGGASLRAAARRSLRARWPRRTRRRSSKYAVSRACADPARDLDRVAEAERVDERAERRLVLMRRRGADQMKARVRVVYSRRYAANALTRSCCALFGASRPTNSQSAPPRRFASDSRSSVAGSGAAASSSAMSSRIGTTDVCP